MLLPVIVNSTVAAWELGGDTLPIIDGVLVMLVVARNSANVRPLPGSGWPCCSTVGDVFAVTPVTVPDEGCCSPSRDEARARVICWLLSGSHKGKNEPMNGNGFNMLLMKHHTVDSTA